MSNACVVVGVVGWLIPLFESVKPIPTTATPPTTTQTEAQHYRLFPVFRLCFTCPNPASIGYASDGQQEMLTHIEWR